MGAPPDLNERILHDFLRFHFVNEHSGQQRIDQAAAALVECRERLLVSVGNAHQQARVLARLY